MDLQEYYNGVNDIFVYDVEKLIDLNEEECNDVAIGPQESFHVKLDEINRNFQYNNVDPIHITSKWNWKPGTYDIVKKYIWNKLDLHKKARNCEYLLGRTQERVNYLRNIHHQFNCLEIERATLKRMGVSSNVDIDEFNEICNKFVQNIQNQCQIASEISDNKVSINPYITLNGRDCNFYLDIHLENLTMEIYDGLPDKINKSIQSFNLEPIHIIAKLNLRQLLANTSQQPKLSGFYQDSICSFPYISLRNRGYRNQGLEYGAVCTDKHSDDVYKALKTTDYTLLTITLLQWAQYFHIKHSNPYNRIYSLHMGLPEDYSKEYKATVDNSSLTRSCGDRIRSQFVSDKFNSFEIDYELHSICKEIKCTLMNECSSFKYALKRKETLASDFGVKSEAIVGMIIEYLRDKYEDKPHRIMDEMNYLGDFYYHREEFQNNDGVWDVDALCTKMSSEVLFNYISSGTWNSMLWDFLLNNNMYEEPARKDLTTEELLALTQAWAQNPERR